MDVIAKALLNINAIRMCKLKYIRNFIIIVYVANEGVMLELTLLYIEMLSNTTILSIFNGAMFINYY